MSTRPWNTAAERSILMDLMELLVQEMDEEDQVEANNLDDDLMDFWEGHDMDVNTLPSVESDDPIEDIDFAEDLDFTDEEPFDSTGELLLMTVVYGQYILQDL
jgi:hypothetical protein